MRSSIVRPKDMECFREFSFSSARQRKSNRRRKSNFTRIAWSCCKGFVATCLLILVLLETASAAAEAGEDWTKLCPGNCKCNWVGRKETADCQGSGFVNIPSGLSPELQELDMSFNWISQLSENEFAKVGLLKLQKVFLRLSKIEKIDRDAFRNLHLIIEIDLSGNELESILMETFEFNERLEVLRINWNPLTKLHGVQFPPLHHLKLLDLSNCQLYELNENTFDNLSNLEQLDLTGNQFQYISEQVFKYLTNLKSLTLQNNPWKCDCRLRSFRDWIVIQKKIYLPLRCAEPGRVENVLWSVLQPNDFACKPEIAALNIRGQATQAPVVYADVGSNITLECIVRANPAPKVKWVRDGQVLANSTLDHGRVYLLNDSGGQYVRSLNLMILKSDLYDAGDYNCVGYNAAGVIEKLLTLNFQDIPAEFGTRVGPGGLLVGKQDGFCRDHFWLWIALSAIAFLVVLTIPIMTLCFCTLQRRVHAARAHDLKVF